MRKCLPRDAIHCAVFAVVRCPSVCHVDVSKQPNNYYQTFSSPGFLKIPMESPSTGAPNRGGVPKICDFQLVFQKYRYRYRILNRHEKIPTKIPNTDTDSKYRYRPSSSSHLSVTVTPIEVVHMGYYCIGHT